jgi:hypothetical protein
MRGGEAEVLSSLDLGGLGVLVSTVTGALVTIGGLLAQRQRKRAVDADDMEDELELRTTQFTVAIRHIRRLEDDRAAHTDLPPVRRPAELRPGWIQAQLNRGRKRRAPTYDDEFGDGADARGLGEPAGDGDPADGQPPPPRASRGGSHRASAGA